MDEAVLRVVAFESFPLIDVDALHGSPISGVARFVSFYETYG
jgi:hypothetical protein